MTPLGDVDLIGRVPLAGLDAESLDRLLGAVLTYADELFGAMLLIGCGSAIRRKWQWRVKRGESTESLPAHHHGGPG